MGVSEACRWATSSERSAAEVSVNLSRVVNDPKLWQLAPSNSRTAAAGAGCSSLRSRVPAMQHTDIALKHAHTAEGARRVDRHPTISATGYSSLAYLKRFPVTR